MRAQKNGYLITLIFFWLDSVDLAIERVKTRVQEGGHNIPNSVISRRYFSGLNNLFNLYIPICDYWMVFNNSKTPSELVAEGYFDKDLDIKNINIFDILKRQSQNDKKR